ncbi:MAG: DNA polymerase III alpha subunit [Nitrospira sp.]|jgi:hypothetical protein|nr:DNA polymerase III alpha subunit [Nitrospira sp.]
MASQFPHVPDALENTIRIAEACHSDWRFGETIFPAFRRLTDEEAFLTLKDKTYAGAQNRYGFITQEVRDRIEKELAIIREKRFAHYFLVVEEIVTALKRTTCGRGSVAASIVSYCLHPESGVKMMTSQFESLDLLERMLPSRLARPTRRQCQAGPVPHSTQLGRHQQDLVAEGLQRGCLKLRRKAEPLVERGWF